MEEKNKASTGSSVDLLLPYVRTLCKPLEYVADNEFANLSTVKGLDETILALVHKALEAAPARQYASVLERVREQFEGFVSLTLDRQRTVVSTALSALRGVEEQLVRLSRKASSREAGVAEAAGDGAGPGQPGDRRESEESGSTILQEAGAATEDSSSPSEGIGGASGSSQPKGGESGSTSPGKTEGGATRSGEENGEQGREESGRKADRATERKKDAGAKAGSDTQRRKETAASRSNRSRGRNQAAAQKVRKKGDDPRKKKKRVSRRARKVVKPVLRDVALAYQERSDQDLSWGRPRRTALLRSPSSAYVADLPPPAADLEEEAGTTQSRAAAAASDSGKSKQRSGRRRKKAARRDHPAGAQETGSQQSAPPREESGKRRSSQGKDADDRKTTRPPVRPAPSSAPLELPPLEGLPKDLSPDGLYHDLTLGDIAEYIEKVEHTATPAGTDGSSGEERPGVQEKSSSPLPQTGESGEPPHDGVRSEAPGDTEVQEKNVLPHGGTTGDDALDMNGDEAARGETGEEEVQVEGRTARDDTAGRVGEPRAGVGEELERAEADGEILEADLGEEEVAEADLGEEEVAEDEDEGGESEEEEEEGLEEEEGFEDDLEEDLDEEEDLEGDVEEDLDEEEELAEYAGEDLEGDVEEDLDGEEELAEDAEEEEDLEDEAEENDLVEVGQEAEEEGLEAGAEEEGDTDEPPESDGEEENGGRPGGSALEQGLEVEVEGLVEGAASLHDPHDADGECTIEEFFEELVRRSGGVLPSKLLKPVVTEAGGDGGERSTGSEGKRVSGSPEASGAGRSGRGRRRRRKRRSAAKAGVSTGTGEGTGGGEGGVDQVQDRLSSPLTDVKGVGSKLGAMLAGKGLKTVGDLLLRLPEDYHDRRTLCRTVDVRAGQSCLVLGTVESSELRAGDRGRDLVVVLQDEGGPIECLWRNVRSNYLRNRFRTGAKFLAWGTAEEVDGRVVLSEPETELISGGPEEEALSLDRIVPVYAPVEGTGQKVLRRIVHEALDLVREGVKDPIPGPIRERQGLVPYEEALRLAHFPGSEESLEACRRRGTAAWRTLAFHELFFLEYALAHSRKVLANESGVSRRLTHSGAARLLRAFPPLTDDQAAALEDIKRDLTSSHPMFRYLHADPRAGAHQLAALAVVHMLESDYQVAVVMPDEYWVEKFAWRLRNLLAPADIEVQTLTSSVRGRTREKLALALRRGECPLVVGTLDLFQNGRQVFKRLGLVVHYQGENIQRLDRKMFARPGSTPDVLILSEHPVHPALLQTLHGAITWSELRAPVGSRGRIRTEIVDDGNRVRIEQRIRSGLEDGQQMIYGVPRQEGGGDRTVQAVIGVAARLRDEVFPGISVGYLHHRLHPAEQRTMVEKFWDSQVQVMVTVAEPDPRLATRRASLLVLEDAERLTLSRVHALRTLAGDSFQEPAVFLVPGREADPEAVKRLRTVVDVDDGFVLAERDCEVRGWRTYPGVRGDEVERLCVADLVLHRDVLNEARREAFRWVDGSPESADGTADQALARLARERWPGLAAEVPLSSSSRSGR